MRFLVDNQLPPSLARWLRDRGHDKVVRATAAASVYDHRVRLAPRISSATHPASHRIRHGEQP